MLWNWIHILCYTPGLPNTVCDKMEQCSLQSCQMHLCFYALNAHSGSTMLKHIYCVYETILLLCQSIWETNMALQRLVTSCHIKFNQNPYSSSSEVEYVAGWRDTWNLSTSIQLMHNVQRMHSKYIYLLTAFDVCISDITCCTLTHCLMIGSIAECIFSTLLQRTRIIASICHKVAVAIVWTVIIRLTFSMFIS